MMSSDNGSKTVNVSAERPSIFVLLAEDQLNSTLQNAIKHVINFFIRRYPSQLSSHLKSHIEELNLVVDFLVQWSYLHRWNGTFTERFFSLQRYNRSGAHLSRVDLFNSIVLVSIFPYLANKLDRYYESVRDRALTNEKFGQQLYELSRNEQILLKHYETVKQLHQMVKILFWISYSAGNQHGPNLPFWLLGNLRIGYVNEQILQARKSTVTQSVTDRLTRVFDFGLKSGAFLIQFLEYWYSRTDVREILATAKTISPPPKPKNLSTSPELCPLCLQKRTNQTALATSGYVFCYLCIHNYVKNNRKCPITGFPCSLEQLIRVFD